MVAAHPNPDVMDEAARVLTAIPGPHSWMDLLESPEKLPVASHPAVQATILQAIARLHLLDAAPLLHRALSSPSDEVRDAAAQAIATLGDSASIPALEGRLAVEATPLVRESILAALDELR